MVDGVALMRQIKAEPKWSAVEVIMFTDDHEAEAVALESEVRCFQKLDIRPLVKYIDELA